MATTLVAAALLSAALHAVWNAGVKSSVEPPLATTARMVASNALALVPLFWAGLPASAAWAWLTLSTALNMGAVSSLLRAYERGAFGADYPMARASSVPLVLPLAAAIAGERPRPLGLADVVSVAVAVLMLARGRSEPRVGSRPALGRTLASAAFTAGCIVCDARGVRCSGSALGYGCVLAIANATLCSASQRR